MQNQFINKKIISLVLAVIEKVIRTKANSSYNLDSRRRREKMDMIGEELERVE